MEVAKLGKYTVIRKLGGGGFGSVYLAQDTDLDRNVALKILHPDIASNEMLSAYFRREAVALARLSHPNIVVIYNYGTLDGKSFIDMEYVEGDNLDQQLRESETMQLVKALPIFEQLLSALGYAHENGIIHRDVKPSNIMITKSGQVKITDFGIAKIAGGAKLTKTGTGAGSLHYMSPEQIRGKDIDPRSDLYAVGVTLYQALTGRTPFEGDTDYELMTHQLNDPPPPPRKVNPTIPLRVEAVILKALEKKPEKRYQSAPEMSEAFRELKGVVNEHQIGVSSQATVVVSKPPRRKPATLLIPIAAVAALACLAVAAYLLFSNGKPEGQDQNLPPVAQTFADSLAKSLTQFRQGDFSLVKQQLPLLRASASAGQKDVILIDQMLAASEFMTQAPDVGKQALTRLSGRYRGMVFSDTLFPKSVITAYKEILDASTVTNPPQVDTPAVLPAIAEGSIEIVVNNWHEFEPVAVLFDGKRERYRGEAITRTGLKKDRYDIRVETHDMGRLTSQAEINGDKVLKTIDLTMDTSPLRVSCRLEGGSGGMPPPAQVFVDDDTRSEWETPFKEPFMRGPHKVWIKHEDYKTVEPPKYIELDGETYLEFTLRPK